MFLSSGGKSSLQVSVPGYLFPFLHLCFFSCNDVALDRSINLLTENNKMILFNSVGFVTQIFSFTDERTGERGMNCFFRVDMY